MSQNSAAKKPLPKVDFAQILQELHPLAQQKLVDLLNSKNPRPSHVVAGVNAYIGEDRKYTVWIAGPDCTFKNPAELHEDQPVGGMPSQQRRLVHYADVPQGEMQQWVSPWVDPRAVPQAEIDWLASASQAPAIADNVRIIREKHADVLSKLLELMTSVSNQTVEPVALLLKFPKGTKCRESHLLLVGFRYSDSGTGLAREGFQLAGPLPAALKKGIWQFPGDVGYEYHVGGWSDGTKSPASWHLYRTPVPHYFEDEYYEKQRLPIRIV